MTLEQFTAKYGQQFYGFINSELGAAMVLTLQSQDPADLAATMPAETQTANSTLFLGQTTGWRACIAVIKDKMIVRPDGTVRDVEATYERDDEFGGGEEAGGPRPAPDAGPMPAATARRPKAKSTNKKKR